VTVRVPARSGHEDHAGYQPVRILGDPQHIGTSVMPGPHGGKRLFPLHYGRRSPLRPLTGEDVAADIRARHRPHDRAGVGLAPIATRGTAGPGPHRPSPQQVRSRPTLDFGTSPLKIYPEAVDKS
jgi:hypothetical protein